MKVVFLSNYYNHHQSELSNAFYQKTDGEYYFIETSVMSEERKKLGYSLGSVPSFVIKYEEDKIRAISLINSADVVIYGSCPESLIKERLKNKKLTFKYSERIYRTKQNLLKFPVRFIRFFKKYGFCKNHYLLCSSAYTSYDYLKTLNFINKAFKWGYFPAFKSYDKPLSLIAKKQENSILWVGRFMKLKRFNHTLEVLKRLKTDGYKVVLNVIGTGELEDDYKDLVKKENLTDTINFLGAMKPEMVREYMEKSQIFLFTSNRQEGWGAVVNEAMNSCCAVVASKEAGSVPYLLNDGENGFIYSNGNVDELFIKTKTLLDDKILREKLSYSAYKTLENEWNAENAVDKFLTLSSELLSGSKKPFIYKTGVLSKAEIIKG
ncbi:MAG: glycosyltransferase [Clostridia bacterium]|nr:glycosyltransferase [Clostridia bacterium]